MIFNDNHFLGIDDARDLLKLAKKSHEQQVEYSKFLEEELEWSMLVLRWSCEYLLNDNQKPSSEGFFTSCVGWHGQALENA